MELGIFEDAKTVDQLVASARTAAADGFASWWMPNIFDLDAITALAVVAREVPEIGLGTAVVPTYPRHPFMLAQQARTLAQISDGRFVLGIGLSHQIVIEGMFGLSYDKPIRHMREYLEILIPLLADGAVDVDGETLSAHGALGAPAPACEVLVAALGTQMLKTTGRLASGTVTWMTGIATLRDHIVPTVSEAAEAAGRPAPKIVAALPVCVTDDDDGARRRIDEQFHFYGSLPSYRAMLDREGVSGPADVALIGNEDQVASSIESLADIGCTTFAAVGAGSGDERGATRSLLNHLVGR